MSVRRRVSKVKWVSSLVIALFQLACTSGPTGVEACPDSQGGSEGYFIGAGDVLQVFVWRQEELSTTVPVRADGKISIPLVEDMEAAGKSPTELGRDIESELGEYLRTPRVNIIVTSQGGANQIQIVGNVSQPKAVPFQENMRILDAMVLVGGLDEFAAGNRAKLVRRIDDRTVECRVKIKDLLVKGDISQNILLAPGDVIIVPQARF